MQLKYTMKYKIRLKYLTNSDHNHKKCNTNIVINKTKIRKRKYMK